MFSRNKRGERRVSPSLYKLLLALHIIVSVGWLGTAYAKLVLELSAMTVGAPDVSRALYLAMEKLNAAFPIAAIGTVVSGVLLSLGTKWGLLAHCWVVTKIVLTVGVIVTAIQLDGRFVRQSIYALSRQATDEWTILGIAFAPKFLLFSLTLAHLLMLGAATVISVYKPWGKTWFGRRKEVGLKVDHATASARGGPSRQHRGQRLSGERDE